MFWIGLIVGIIIGFIAGYGYVLSIAIRTCGSWEKAAESGQAIITACENRKSELRVYHDDECLDTVTFEEL